MTNGRKRLTDALSHQIATEHKGGATYAVLAERHGLSQGTIATALKRARLAKPSAPALPPSGELAAIEEADGVTELLDTAERLSRAAEAEGNLPGVATMGRLRVALLEHRRKATPPPSLEQQGMVLVPAGEMEALGAEVQARLLKAVELVLEGSESWPTCHACGHLIAPQVTP